MITELVCTAVAVGLYLNTLDADFCYDDSKKFQHAVIYKQPAVQAVMLFVLKHLIHACSNNAMDSGE
ncbi:hypothetical protein ILYODFUR_016857 [Ilyodon furcidens]|uniref:Uncharacterized protein n=1 Tax=Ilyodon furcidens TaxID=33524 RepID=A0ABV0UGM9_9TELE